MTTMEPLVHIRAGETFVGLCGAGYAWPSSVRFERKGQAATCQACLDRQDKFTWYPGDTTPVEKAPEA